MTASKFENICKNIFYLFFCTGFFWLIVNILFFNPYFDYKWYVVIPIARLWFLAFFAIYKIIAKNEQKIDNNKSKYLLLFFVVLTVTQVIMFRICGGYPTRDFERVFSGAYNYAVTGEILDPYLDYFYKFPNNLPLTVVYQFIFRVFLKFGVRDHGFFIVGALFNAFCIDLAYLFVFLSVQLISDSKDAFFAICILYFCLPLQTYISIFYTDTTTMLYAPIMLYFYTYISKSDDKNKKIIAVVLMCLMAAFGIKIKYSVAIALIAVLINCIVKFDFKNFVCIALSTAIAFFSISTVIDGFVYKNILDKNLAYDMSTPFLAWIAMGMDGDGTHNAGDNYAIWSQDTHQQKVDMAKLQLKYRLESKGVAGTIKFLNKKSVRSFGSGNLDYISTVSDSPMHQNVMIDILNRQGKYNNIYDNIIQGYHVLIMTMTAFSGILWFLKHNDNIFIAQLSCMGLLLFLLLWEAGTRYLLNYYPMFVICANTALSYINNKKNI